MASQTSDFELAQGEPAGPGLKRIARAQLDAITAHLDRHDDRSVHEARKAFKRLRALVRLTRDQLGDEIRRRENAAFRDAGRQLSGARDAQVLVETLDKLDPEAFAVLREALAADAAGDPDTASVRAAVDEARTRVDAWPLDEDSVTALAPGVARIQKRGRRAYRDAKKDPSAEHLHELRKRTKDLWHAAQILRADKLAKRAHKLADLLGDDHDLATLREAADRHSEALTPDERERLEGLIADRSKRLQRKALRRASALYTVKPRKLSKILTTG